MTYDQKDELIHRIADEYTIGGKINWRAAFEEHPDWKAALKPQMQNVYVRAGVLRKQGKLGAGSNRLAVVRKTPTPSAPGDENAIVRQIVEQYSGKDGRVSFRQAFIDHPEWEQALNHITRMALSFRAARIKKVLKAERRASKPERNGQSNGHSVPVVIKGEPVAAPARKVVNFCPHCGENLGLINRTYEIIQGL